jgi:hypothetical protein
LDARKPELVLAVPEQLALTLDQLAKPLFLNALAAHITLAARDFSNRTFAPFLLHFNTPEIFRR